jgi:hypothetical protein
MTSARAGAISSMKAAAMTELLTPSSPHSNYRHALAYCGVIIGYIAFNSIALWVMYYQRPENEYLIAFAVGAFAFEAVSVGMWLAMGAGAFVTRLPFVIASFCVVCTAISLVSTSIERMERIEFIAILLSGGLIVFLAFILFLIVRRFIRRRVVSQDSPRGGEAGKVRFNMRYLLTLTTVVAVALGTASQLKFKNPEPRPYFGADFAIYMTIIGGLMVSYVVLPAAAVPLIVLHGGASKRTLGFAAGFWFAVTFSAALYWALNDEGPLPDLVLAILVAQFGAALVGAFAAMVLWLAGFRLEQIRKDNVKSVLVSSNL